MKTTFNKMSVSSAVFFAALSLVGQSAHADTVLYSFNDEIIAVESRGSIYNIPKNAFRSHFGQPEYAKRIELSNEFEQYRVYEGRSLSEQQSPREETHLTAKYFNYGGVYYKQYGEAYARLGTEKGNGTPLFSWTTLANNMSSVDRAPAAELVQSSIGFLTAANNTTISGRMLPTESDEVFVIDDGGSLYWVKKSEEGAKQNSFSESQILWSASYK